MSDKKKGKKSKGYVPGDALGNFMRAFWGVPKLDLYNLPRRIGHDVLRQFIIAQCYDFPLTAQSRQIRFFTCAELTAMALKSSVLILPKPNKEGTDHALSLQRRIRNACRELGVDLKMGRVGRPKS